MILTKDLLYIHIPKTAGTSVRNVLYKNLPPPIIDNISCGNPDKHLNIKQVQELFPRFLMTWKDIQKVLVIYRNPYAVEVSLYFHFLRDPFDVRGMRDPFTDKIKQGSFSDFLKTNKWPNFDYFLAGFPEDQKNKLVILKLEDNLDWKLKEFFITLGLGNRTNWQLPVLNSTKHEPFETYYTPELEKIVYNKYKRVFDEGWYERMKI